jgi:hypothetical protein
MMDNVRIVIVILIYDRHTPSSLCKLNFSQYGNLKFQIDLGRLRIGVGDA